MTGAENSGPAVCLVHAFDPRGTKMGGLETYVRDFIAFRPPDMRLLVVGVDGRGDLRPGEVETIFVRGRWVDFLPVLAWPDVGADGAATCLGRSLTLHFALGLLRHAPRLRRLLRRGGYTLDSRRVELAPVLALLGVPLVQMMRDEGRKTERDALIDRFLWLYRLAERLAVRRSARFFCVNPLITERTRRRFPAQAGKIATVTTWYDPAVLRPTAFPTDDDVLRVFYAGRLDVVKNPAVMFRAVAHLRELRGGRGVEFHYLGGWDPARYKEFEAIRAITVCHGYRTMAEQAGIMAGLHIGLLTSTMEGMPRAVLEGLGAGRPVAAVHLPQLEAVIRPGVSGGLVARGEPERMARDLAALVLGIWADMHEGPTREGPTREGPTRERLTPEGIASAVQDYTPQKRLGLVYAEHRALQAGGASPLARPLDTAGAVP